MICAFMSGAGNVFALIDTIHGELPTDAPAWTRRVCADASSPLYERALAAGLQAPVGRALDGVLVLAPARAAGHVAMQVLNADGSRSEACGNGLRCLARFARELGHAATDLVQVETEAGLRTVELLRTGGAATRARASMGVVRLGVAEFEVASADDHFEARSVDVGNPHCVVFVDDLARAPVARLGAALQSDERFPRGTNVEFVHATGEGLELRVWERGVGETAACGTGACAAAIAAEDRGRTELPIAVTLPGGRLLVGRGADGEPWIEGECLIHAMGEWTLAHEHATGEPT